MAQFYLQCITFELSILYHVAHGSIWNTDICFKWNSVTSYNRNIWSRSRWFDCQKKWITNKWKKFLLKYFLSHAFTLRDFLISLLRPDSTAPAVRIVKVSINKQKPIFSFRSGCELMWPKPKSLAIAQRIRTGCENLPRMFYHLIPITSVTFLKL